MSFYNTVGKVVIGFIILVVVLAYFGVLTPSKANQVTPEENEILTILKQIDLDIGRYSVYLQENKWDDAKNALTDAKLKLSDVEIQASSLSSNDNYKADLINLISAYKPFLDALDSSIDYRKIKSQKDSLTRDKYNQLVNKYVDARNNFAAFYNQANKIQSDEIKTNLNLTNYITSIKDMDSQIKDLQSENMTNLVDVNTFISKINPLDGDVRYTATSIEKAYGNNLNQRMLGILTYFSTNLTYIHIPNWNPNSNIQYIQDPNTTLLQKGGNCADLSILFSSLAESVGIPTKFCFADTKHSYFEIQNKPELFKSDHAVIQYSDEQQNWLTLDPTCFAGTDLQIGDECNQKINYTVECYEVQKLQEALRFDINK